MSSIESKANTEKFNNKNNNSNINSNNDIGSLSLEQRIKDFGQGINFGNIGILSPYVLEKSSTETVLSSLLDFLSPMSSSSMPPYSNEVSSNPEEVSFLNSLDEFQLQDSDLKKAFEEDFTQVHLNTNSNKNNTKSSNNTSTKTEVIEIPGYLFTKLISKSGFSKVYLGKHILTRKQVVLKSIDKQNSSSDRVLREIMVHKQLHHRNICELLEVATTSTDSRRINLVIEYCNSGELFYYVKQTNGLEESEARRLFIELLDAVAYCHSKNVAHRDIKLENIMLHRDSSGTLILKLIDFGLTNVYSDADKLLKTQCGSPDYAAPEMLLGKPYDAEKSDVWSLGVCLFCILTAELPFAAPSTSRTFSNVVMGRFQYPAAKDQQLSSKVKSLISQMLTVTSEQRISLNQIYQHQWINASSNTTEATISLDRMRIIEPKVLSMGFSNADIQTYLKTKIPCPIHAAFYLINTDYPLNTTNSVRQLPMDEKKRTFENIN